MPAQILPFSGQLNLKITYRLFTFMLLFIVFTLGCEKDKGPIHVSTPPNNGQDSLACLQLDFDYTEQEGCDGQVYNNPANSPYRLPLEEGQTFRMGLTNCSSSYHGDGQPDQYAFDFNMPEGAPFYAARGGKVVAVEESKPSTGGGVGNYVVIKHNDTTHGLYYHSPRNGIYVEVDDVVAQGDVLGEIGRSGLAGYPHLHFIVVRGSYNYPYQGIPVSFKNVFPADVVLETNATYRVCE